MFRLISKLLFCFCFGGGGIYMLIQPFNRPLRGYSNAAFFLAIFFKSGLP